MFSWFKNLACPFERIARENQQRRQAVLELLNQCRCGSRKIADWPFCKYFKCDSCGTVYGYCDDNEVQYTQWKIKQREVT